MPKREPEVMQARLFPGNRGECTSRAPAGSDLYWFAPVRDCLDSFHRPNSRLSQRVEANATFTIRIRIARKEPMNPKVDGYLKRSKKWREELTKLRKIVLGAGLTEELKWGKPCYAFDGSNLVILIGFKEYCGLLFCKGALLKDPKGILIKPGASTQAARQLRFTNVRDIVKMTPVLKAYVREAIAAEKAG
jgi:hypothetical protein